MTMVGLIWELTVEGLGLGTGALDSLVLGGLAMEGELLVKVFACNKCVIALLRLSRSPTCHLNDLALV